MVVFSTFSRLIIPLRRTVYSVYSRLTGAIIVHLVVIP